MKIVIGNDHSGVELKNVISNHLINKGYDIINVGTDSTEAIDYPIPGKAIAEEVLSGNADLGIAICGTGVGISLVVNKIKGIRAVVCSEPFSAKLSREHNNTNILALGARVVNSGLALMILDMWLEASFQGGRHQTRVDMIEQL